MRMNDEERANCDAAEQRLEENVSDAEQRLKLAKEQLDRFRAAKREVEEQSVSCEKKERDLRLFRDCVEDAKRGFVRNVAELRTKLADYVLETAGVDMIEQGLATESGAVEPHRFEEQILEYHAEVSQLYRISHHDHHSNRKTLHEYAHASGAKFEKFHGDLGKRLDVLEKRINTLESEMPEHVWQQGFKNLEGMVQQVHEYGLLDQGEPEEGSEPCSTQTKCEVVSARMASEDARDLRGDEEPLLFIEADRSDCED